MRWGSGSLAKATLTESTLFSTHPPLEARLEALARYESQLQGTAR